MNRSTEMKQKMKTEMKTTTTTKHENKIPSQTNVWTPRGENGRGWGGGGMNWEIGIDMYTLMCIK